MTAWNLDNKRRNYIVDFIIDLSGQVVSSTEPWWWATTGGLTICECDRPEIVADRIFHFVWGILEEDGFFDDVLYDDDGNEIAEVDFAAEVASQLLGGPLYPPELVC